MKNGVETLGPGLDIRGDGGYVIVPPSLHASGKRYTWELSHLPDETALAPMPPWLLALCQDHTPRASVSAGDPIPQGHRNNTLFQFGCSLRARGCTEAVILAAIREMNATQCQPPLDDAEVTTIAASCATYPAGQICDDAHQRRNGSALTADGAQRQATSGAARQLRVTPLAAVTPERVQWLWKPYLPLGRPVALEGDPGVGKSSLIAKIVAHLTSGQAFPNVIHGQAPQRLSACNVCLLTAEDDPGDTILPRIAVNGGDPARVYLIEGWHQPDGAQGPVTMQDLDLLTQALEQHTPRLLVFDPVQSFFGRRVDMNSASDTRPVLDAVVALCKHHTCTPLFVRHIGKARREKALYAGLGSIDITAAMRSVVFLGQDPDQDSRRILAQSKANNAKLGPSLAYRIVSVDQDLLTPHGGPGHG